MARSCRPKLVFNVSAMLRFHLPLVKLDVRFSRIQLSDKDHVFAHEKLRVRSGSLISPKVRWRYSSG